MDPRGGRCGSGYGVPGFAERYDASRPGTPTALVDLLCQYARRPGGAWRPRLVVDLGCGTGHSTAVWAGRADAVVGVEMEPAMLAVARRRVTAPDVEFREGFAHATGLPAGAADIVTCVQSFHWMEPESTLAEVARILRPGGVFAAVDWAMPAMDWEAEAADLRFIQTVRRLRREHGLDAAEPRRNRASGASGPRTATWTRSGAAGTSATPGRSCCTRRSAAAPSAWC